MFSSKHFHEAMCTLSDNIKDYYVVSQGKTTIPNLDDGEELEATDVRWYEIWAFPHNCIGPLIEKPTRNCSFHKYPNNRKSCCERTTQQNYDKSLIENVDDDIID